MTAAATPSVFRVLLIRFPPLLVVREYSPAHMDEAVRSQVTGLETRSRKMKLSAVRLGHLAVVESLVQDGLLDPGVTRDLAQRAAGRRRLLHDLGDLVVADVRIERGRRGERELGIALADLAVRLDSVHA